MNSTLITPDYYETSKGHKLKIITVSSALIADVSQTVELPKPPQYEATLAGGGVQQFDHDESTLKTDEDKAAWIEYKRLLKMAEGAQFNAVIKMLLLHGFEMPAVDSDWLESIQEMGIPIPSGKYEFRKWYLERYLMGSPTEVMELVFAIMQRSQDIPEEAIAAIQAAFKSGMEEFRAGIATHVKESLDLHQSARNGDHGAGLGTDSQRVQPTSNTG